MCQRSREHRSIAAEVSDTGMGRLLDKSLNENVGRDFSEMGNRDKSFCT